MYLGGNHVTFIVLASNCTMRPGTPSGVSNSKVSIGTQVKAPFLMISSNRIFEYSVNVSISLLRLSKENVLDLSVDSFSLATP